MPTPAHKVFIIDDSVLIRYALTELLHQEPDFVVVGDSPPIPDLPKLIERAKPDILIFDIPLPRDTGIKELKSLHKFHLPAIVFTKSDKDITRDLLPLLEAGAVGFVIKPEKDTDVKDIKDRLLFELRLNTKHYARRDTTVLDPPWAVAIGSSTGGPEALLHVIPQFPPNFPAGIALVQHMPEGFTTKFAQRLNDHSQIPVKEADDGDVLKAGTVLMAPGDYHMIFTESIHDKRRQAKVKLTKDPPQWQLRPTVDHMMTSLSPIFGHRIIGVILTGMGQDGVVGMRSIKQQGGRTLVQNKDTSAVFGMAQEVIKNNLADEVLPLNQLASRIMELL